MVKNDHKITAQSNKSTASTASTSSSSSASSSSTYRKKYKGVRMRSWGSWVSEIRAPNQKTRIWLGSYSSAEAAARAYDAALICLKGTSANLNFPLSSSLHLPDTTMSPKSIQRVAAAAANKFFDNATTPIPCSSSSNSSISISSPPSDRTDDDLLVSQSFLSDESTTMITPWYDFEDPQSHQMYNNGFFDPAMNEEFYEEGDISLWSFN